MRTQRWCLTVVVLLIFCQLAVGQTLVPSKGLAAISQQKISKHLHIIASDAMRGRNTPSPELDSCAGYIAREFSKYGLKPAAANGSYFQTFNLLKTRLDQPNTLIVHTANKDTAFTLKSDFVPIYLSASKTVRAPLVFAGYGITAPKLHYDDYEDIDAKGKIVLLFTHEPQERDSVSVFDGRRLTDYSKIEYKAVNARDHGAVGMILVTDPNHRFNRPPNPWPSLMRHPVKNAIPLSLEEKAENKLVAVRIGKSLAEYLIKGTGKSFKQIQKEIDASLMPQSFELPNVIVEMTTSLRAEKFRTQNVVGILGGRDPDLKEEAIVIGAHYDHLGTRNDTIIYNGADDNASGTVGVLTLAEAFCKSEKLPRRSILFCTWAGEEKGLFGSRYFVDSAPLVPLENIVANINLDMIGRNDSGKVQIDGMESSSDLAALLFQANEKEKMKIILKKISSGSSDHASFLRKKIPALEFFTGFHPDYHQPTDTADKCFPDGIAQICRLVFRTVWLLAEFPNRPSFNAKPSGK